MRRIMKKVDYGFSSPVLCPPPFFVTSLRKLLGDLYWNSHDLRPRYTSAILGALFHPDYHLDRSLTCPIQSMVMYVNYIHEDPGYVLERVTACMKRLKDHGIKEMTLELFIDLLKQANQRAVEAATKLTGQRKTYYRILGNEWQFLTGPENLFKSKNATIRNEPNTPKEFKWRLLTLDNLKEINSEVLVPSGVLRIEREYVNLRKDGSYYTLPTMQQIDWDCLLKLIPLR